MKKKLGNLAESNIRLVGESDVYKQKRINVLSNETTENISSYKKTVTKMLNLKWMFFYKKYAKVSVSYLKIKL